MMFGDDGMPMDMSFDAQQWVEWREQEVEQQDDRKNTSLAILELRKCSKKKDMSTLQTEAGMIR